MSKPYRATSLKSAERQVNRLRKEAAERQEFTNKLLVQKAKCEAAMILMARLAADKPQFSNPLHVIEAKKVRDQILDGTFE